MKYEKFKERFDAFLKDTPKEMELPGSVEEILQEGDFPFNKETLSSVSLALGLLKANADINKMPDIGCILISAVESVDFKNAVFEADLSASDKIQELIKKSCENPFAPKGFFNKFAAQAYADKVIDIFKKCYKLNCGAIPKA